MLFLKAKSGSSKVILLQTTASQVHHAVIGFFQPSCSGFLERINVGAAKGWVRYLREKDLSDELSSAVEDGWLNISVKITLISDKAFGNAHSPIIGILPSHSLPKIDSRTEIQHQGNNRFLRTAITWDRSPYDRRRWNG